MKKIVAFALLMGLLFAAWAENGTEESADDSGKPEKKREPFVEKGSWSWGVSGSYFIFDVSGANDSDGFQIISILNVGSGQLQRWSIAPSFSYLIADDLALGVRLGYDGYHFDATLNIDARSLVDDKDANFQIASREVNHHKWTMALTLRKYIPFFESKTFGVFGEARLYGSAAITDSSPIKDKSSDTFTTSINTGLQACAGAIVKLKNNGAITLSIPLASVKYAWTKQDSEKDGVRNVAYANKFSIARDLELLGIQLGYTHYIGPKKKSNKTLLDMDLEPGAL